MCTLHENTSNVTALHRKRLIRMKVEVFRSIGGSDSSEVEINVSCQRESMEEILDVMLIR